MAVPPVFVSGQVLTAAQMNKVGRWLVKTQTVGTTVTSTVVTGAFSTDYESYEIVLSGGSMSAGAQMYMTLGATATNYYWFNSVGLWNNTVATSAGNNTTSWYIGTGATGLGHAVHLFVARPFLTDETWYEGRYVIPNTTATVGGSGFTGGFLNNTTSYTDFTVTYSGGTATGGTIEVYGLRD